MTFVAALSQQGFAQDSFEVCSEEQAIEELRSSNFLDIYKSEPHDPMNVERLIEEVEKIVPLEKPKKARLNEQLSDVPGNMVEWSFSRPPFISTEVEGILRDNFTADEYNRLSAAFAEKLIAMKVAYGYLSSLFQKRKGVVPFGYPGTREHINSVCAYFGI